MAQPGRYRHREPATGREPPVACSPGDILAGDPSLASDGEQSYPGDYELPNAALSLRFDPRRRGLVSLLRSREAAAGASPRASGTSGIPHRSFLVTFTRLPAKFFFTERQF